MVKFGIEKTKSFILKIAMLIIKIIKKERIKKLELSIIIIIGNNKMNYIKLLSRLKY